MRVEHVMTKDPVACDVNEPVEAVARLMRDKGVGCVVCLRDGKVAGIVTDRQLAVGVLGEGLGADTPVEDVMTADPACLSPDDLVFSALDTMRSAGVVRRVPIVDDDGKLVGIVSISDIAVLAKDMLDAILLEETHHSLVEAKVLTGAKRVVEDIHGPGRRGGDSPPGQEAQAVASAMSGGASKGDAGSKRRGSGGQASR